MKEFMKAITDNFVILVTIIALTVIVCVSTFVSPQKSSKDVEIEAIRAGLVQDEKGHWVKPELLK